MIMQRLFLVCLLILWAPAVPAVATGWDEPPEAPAGDSDRAAAEQAFQAEDWQGVITHMSRVAHRRPWDDEAHNLLGYAHRRLGDYDRALEHYHQALELNPHNRDVMEYLGEAYLELNRPDDAKMLLGRLAQECRRRDESQEDCQAWRELEAAWERYLSAR